MSSSPVLQVCPHTIYPAIHGPALTVYLGTGKSVLMRATIGLWPPDSPRLAITASTGAASVHFAGGRTVHSWAGIGLGTKDADLLVAGIMDDKHKRDAWLDTDCLLIDESSSGCFQFSCSRLLTPSSVSMIDDELFDKLVCGST